MPRVSDSSRSCAGVARRGQTKMIMGLDVCRRPMIIGNTSSVFARQHRSGGRVSSLEMGKRRPANPLSLCRGRKAPPSGQAEGMAKGRMMLIAIELVIILFSLRSTKSVQPDGITPVAGHSRSEYNRGNGAQSSHHACFSIDSFRNLHLRTGWRPVIAKIGTLATQLGPVGGYRACRKSHPPPPRVGQETVR